MLEKVERYAYCFHVCPGCRYQYSRVFCLLRLPLLLKQSTELLENTYFQNAKQKLVKLGEFQRKVKQRVGRCKRKETDDRRQVALPVVSEVSEKKKKAWNLFVCIVWEVGIASILQSRYIMPGHWLPASLLIRLIQSPHSTVYYNLSSELCWGRRGRGKERLAWWNWMLCCAHLLKLLKQDQIAL